MKVFDVMFYSNEISSDETQDELLGYILLVPFSVYSLSLQADERFSRSL